MAKSKNRQRCKICTKPVTPKSDTVESTQHGTIHRECMPLATN